MPDPTPGEGNAPGVRSDDYLSLNRANWDDRAPIHFESGDYAVDSYRADPNKISAVVQFDRERLGEVAGLRIVHLQCHIGTDTVSLARLGATVTGLDFSPVSVAGARELAARSGANVEFVESDVYSAVTNLGATRFDLVYTGIGALCWLPDIAEWARTVAALLVPGGRLFIREGHPMLWAIDESHSDDLVLRFPYFEQPDPMVWDDDSSYVETDKRIGATVTHEWNHGIGEIISALFAAGLQLTEFVEHSSAPWEALPGRMSRGADQEWRVVEHPECLPLTYTLQAVKVR
jgi:SAM-dependent methyltransferase